MAEIRIGCQDRFLCRAICLELAGETISLKEIEKASAARCKQVKAGFFQLRSWSKRYEMKSERKDNMPHHNFLFSRLRSSSKRHLIINERKDSIIPRYNLLLPPVPEIIHQAQFPVYGLVDHPLDLVVCSYEVNGFHNRYSAIGFGYSSFRYPQARVNVSIVSLSPHREGIVYDAKDAAGKLLRDGDAELFDTYQLSHEVRKQAGNPKIFSKTLSIAETIFTGEIRYWSHPHQLSRSFLTSEETLLAVSTFGPSLEELLQLLQATTVINSLEDLLAQYQQELDQEGERLKNEDSRLKKPT